MVTARTRRVIVGVDDEGRSTIVEDGVTHARTVRPNASIVDEIWRQEWFPGYVGNDDAGGVLAIRMLTVPPDLDEHVAAYVAILGEWPDTHTGAGSEAPPPFSVVTVVSGEVRAALHTDVVVLRQGDTLVIPGVQPEWTNPTNRPAQLFCVVLEPES